MKYFIIFFFFCPLVGATQPNAPLILFSNFAREDSANLHLTNRVIKENGRLNYLAPLLYNYAYKSQLLATQPQDSYFDNLTQTLSFLGDFKSVLHYLPFSYQVVDSGLANYLKERIDGFKGAIVKDAREFISQVAATHQVVMINEAHCKPVHRAFVYSLLSDFYKDGFRYLALETLTNNPFLSQTELTQNTGYYTCEPLYGELVRKALSLGFKLIPYEDTVYSSTARRRDSAQAKHLWQVIQKDPSAKLLVFAGYGHIEKQKIDDTFHPMAFQFKSMSNIDPYCIDQTSFTEGGNEGFSRLYYDLLLQHFPVQKPSVLMKDNQLIKYLPGEDRYDLTIVHPGSTYDLQRANWYTLNNERKEVVVRSNKEGTFLVQAYYANEYSTDSLLSAIPADQTYLQTKRQHYPLLLRKGKYVIIFRDMRYNILGIKKKTIR